MAYTHRHNHHLAAQHTRPDPSYGQVALSGQLVCANADQLQIVLEFVSDHIAASRAELGCLYFDIFQTTNPLVWQVEELYLNENALAAHKVRTAASIWAIKTIELGRDIHRIHG